MHSLFRRPTLAGGRRFEGGVQRKWRAARRPLAAQFRAPGAALRPRTAVAPSYPFDAELEPDPYIAEDRVAFQRKRLAELRALKSSLEDEARREADCAGISFRSMRSPLNIPCCGNSSAS